ncbi:MAG: hypothetical protein EOO90_23120 [Pedobacter sp.]|nr:MAG: hypothetical protein EOO90_23120 [Pedobacter sp.]
MGEDYEVLNEAMIPDGGMLSVEAGDEDAPLPVHQRNNGGLALVLRSVNSGSGRLVAAEVQYETVIRAVQTYVVLSCDTDGVWGGGYQYGFNGQRKTDEISGSGNSVDFKYRGLDTRLGRFRSVDPLAAQYPWNSTYAFAENDVIQAKDLEGAERLVVIHGHTRTSSEVLTVRTEEISGFTRDAATAGFAIRHPVVANAVGAVERGGTNISSVAGRIARHVSENDNMSTADGGERNAFRHVLWQATITNQYGSHIAEKLGNAHEGIKLAESGRVDFNMPLVQDLAVADEVVDFLNNQLGRSIGANLPEGASQIDIARETLKFQRSHGFWTTGTDQDGNMTISRNKISQDQYKAAVERLGALDQNGMNESDRRQIENE